MVLYLALRRGLGDRHIFVISILACVAWNPALLAITSSVSNDCLQYFWCAVAVLVFARCRFSICSTGASLTLGVVLGLGMLTKSPFFPIIPCILFTHFYQRGNSSNWKGPLLMTVTACVVVSPWLIWNWKHYHALTAVPLLIHDVRTSIGSVKIESVPALVRYLVSGTAYHFLPTEFWLNQFTTPLVLKGTIALFVLTGLASATLTATKYLLTRTNVATFECFSAFYYCIAMAAWLSCGLLLDAIPVRDFFGSYYAFSYFLNKGVIEQLDRVAKMASGLKLHSLKYCLLPFILLCVNIWLITNKVGALKGYGLHPSLMP